MVWPEIVVWCIWTISWCSARHLKSTQTIWGRYSNNSNRQGCACETHEVFFHTAFSWHIVSTEGITTDPKLMPFLIFQCPKMWKVYNHFLVLLPTIGNLWETSPKIAHPLYQLTKKTLYLCETVNVRKHRISWKPLWQTPLPWLSPTLFIMKTDTSTLSLGAVLSQYQPDESLRPFFMQVGPCKNMKLHFVIMELLSWRLLELFRPWSTSALISMAISVQLHVSLTIKRWNLS